VDWDVDWDVDRDIDRDVDWDIDRDVDRDIDGDVDWDIDRDVYGDVDRDVDRNIDRDVGQDVRVGVGVGAAVGAGLEPLGVVADVGAGATAWREPERGRSHREQHEQDPKLPGQAHDILQARRTRSSPGGGTGCPRAYQETR